MSATTSEARIFTALRKRHHFSVKRAKHIVAKHRATIDFGASMGVSVKYNLEFILEKEKFR